MMLDVSYKTAAPANPIIATENQVPSSNPNIKLPTIPAIARKKPQTSKPRRNVKSLPVTMTVAIRPTQPRIVTPAALSMMPGYIR